MVTVALLSNNRSGMSVDKATVKLSNKGSKRSSSMIVMDTSTDVTS